jgi:hypothetical protein
MLHSKRNVYRLLAAVGAAALLTSCGLTQDDVQHPAIPAAVKTATVGDLTQSCSRWRADATLVANNKSPIAKDLGAIDAEPESLEHQLGGYFSSRASAIRAIDGAIRKSKAGVTAINRTPKEPDAAFAAIRRDLRAGVVLRLKALRLIRRSVVERKPVLQVDAFRMDRDGIERYRRGVNAKSALQAALAAQCPGQPW